jgi:hypothetical protein
MDCRAFWAALIVAMFALTALAGVSPFRGGGLGEVSASPGLGAARADAPHPAPLLAAYHPVATSPEISGLITVILPNGTISGAVAPLVRSGSNYSLTAGFTGAI